MLHYNTFLELGFKRNDLLSSDDCFLKQYGYKCFWLEYPIILNGSMNEPIGYESHIEWRPDTQKLEIVDSIDGDIKKRIEITEAELLALVDIYNRSGDLPIISNQRYFC